MGRSRKELPSTAAPSQAPPKRQQQDKSRQALQLPPVSSKQGPPKVTLLKGRDLFQVEGVLTTAEAQRFVDAIESSGQLSHQSSRGPKYGEAFRDNERLAVQDAALAARLWEATGLRQAFADMDAGGAAAVGLNPNIRFYRYGPGQRFGPHIDEANDLGGGRVTRFTLLIYLSGGAGSSTQLRGGETVFYGGRGKVVASVAPHAGMALLHLHGEQCLEHEGAAVAAGFKYVLRSDVVFRRCG